MEMVFILSVGGFTSSLVLHLLAAFGLAEIPLSVAFWTFFPAMIVAVGVNTRIIFQRHRDYISLPPGEFWRYISQNAPRWMHRLQIGMLLYAFFNFYFTMLVINRGAYPRIIDGVYVLERHKTIIETLTRQEYLWHAGFVVRTLSSISMAVFFAALTRWVARWQTVDASQPEMREEVAS